MSLEMIKIPLPDPKQLAALVANNPPACWFDSALAGDPRSKQSMVLMKPRLLKQDHFEFFEPILESMRAEFSGTPFCGGVVGFLSYEFWNHFKIKPKKYWGNFPLAYFMLADSGILINHETGEAKIFSLGLDEAFKNNRDLAKKTCEEIANLLQQTILSKPVFTSVTNSGSQLSRKKYFQKINEIKKRILRGDVYQVNFSQSFWAEGDFDPAALYLKLRVTSPAPQMCFFNLGKQQILSASPELLFEINEELIRSYPIKGTLPRGKSEQEDQELAQQLWNSPKDNAELLMIIDLVRNDLGKFCETGSVEVPKLKILDSLPQVHHLYAEVTGKIRQGTATFTPLWEMFPGGSITGAPKQKAMEILSELEETPRGIYTGSIGYFGFNGQSSFNIAIRTALLEGTRLSFSAGGGIVADSDPEKEFEECLHKARGFFETLNIDKYSTFALNPSELS